MTVPHPPHGVEELCEAGLELYTRALREGQVAAGKVELLPCLIEAGLLQTDLANAHRLKPVPPAVALARLQRAADDDIAERRRQSARLTETFEPLLALVVPDNGTTDAFGIRLLSGLDRGRRIRTLYQHTQRHIPETLARYEQLGGDVEAPTLDEVTDRLWRLATPMHPQTVHHPSHSGVTPRQRAIALGSDSRAQLGYLIAQSRFLDRER
ncbi:hypothetical protein ACVNF4_16710 [Streptomyces sp. S6]